MLLRAIVLVGLLSGTAATAEEVYRLTPAQRDAAIAAGSQRTDTDTPALLPAPGLADLDGRSLYDDQDPGKPDRKIHGEMGMFVGTGGTRGIFGTAVVPLGDNATATLSFSQGEGRGYGYGGYGYGGWGYGGYGYGFADTPYPYQLSGRGPNRRYVR
jgi:hypothetical protein